MQKTKDSILFLCTGNSCRSQMAEAFMEKYHGDQFSCYSAGTNPTRVKPGAIAVMQEKGIDISDNESHYVKDLPINSADYVITVCDNARENCSYFPATKKILHQSFDDPPALVQKGETEEEQLQHYRRVRNEIEGYIKKLPEVLRKSDQ